MYTHNQKVGSFFSLVWKCLCLSIERYFIFAVLLLYLCLSGNAAPFAKKKLAWIKRLVQFGPLWVLLVRFRFLRAWILGRIQGLCWGKIKHAKKTVPLTFATYFHLVFRKRPVLYCIFTPISNVPSVRTYFYVCLYLPTTYVSSTYIRFNYFHTFRVIKIIGSEWCENDNVSLRR